MKFGLTIPGTTLMPGGNEPWAATATPEDMLRVARKADELGFDWIAVPEHIVMLQPMVEVMGARFPHAVTTLAFFAGATKKIRLVNGVVVIGYHNPVELAKMFATLDFLSGGRVIVGLGVGYLRREFAILKADHAGRGAIADEYIDAMIELWTSDTPTFQGEHVSFERIAFEPKPAQKPHPPIWIGGHSRPSMRRAARIGDGWWPWQITRAELPARLEYIRQQPGLRDRPRPFDVVMPLYESKVDDRHNVIEPARIATTRDGVLDDVGRLKEAGATGASLAFKPSRDVNEFAESLEWFAQEVFPEAKR
ncbi:MAG: LLM class flavin-dependent oxidoreductase [Dehalococcoidia bacterium]